MAILTKIIRNGNSQAIRIPASMRLDAKEVEIYDNGQGSLLIVDPAKRAERLAALEGIREKPARRKRALAGV